MSPGEERWTVNGQETSSVAIADRGLAYGDGLFETMAVRDGVVRLLERHLARVVAGCRRLGIPVAEAGIRAAVRARAAGESSAVLKLVVTRGPGPRGYAHPDVVQPTIAIGVASVKRELSLPVVVRWCRTEAPISPATAGLKTLGRLEQVLARREWSERGIAEGLMSTADGEVVSGTASNLFLVTAGRLLTPGMERAGVAGIMRALVCEIAVGQGLVVNEMRLERREVMAADELFLTSALTGIRPVVQLEDRHWTPGPITRTLAQVLSEQGVSECDPGAW